MACACCTRSVTMAAVSSAASASPALTIAGRDVAWAGLSRSRRCARLRAYSSLCCCSFPSFALQTKKKKKKRRKKGRASRHGAWRARRAHACSRQHGAARFHRAGVAPHTRRGARNARARHPLCGVYAWCYLILLPRFALLILFSVSSVIISAISIGVARLQTRQRLPQALRRSPGPAAASPPTTKRRGMAPSPRACHAYYGAVNRTPRARRCSGMPDSPVCCAALQAGGAQRV